MTRDRRSGPSTEGGAGASGDKTPGRRTLTSGLTVQRKALSLGTPGDEAEQQADRVAAAVTTALSGGPPAQVEQAKSVAATEIRRSAVTGASSAPVEADQADAIAEARAGGGQSLPSGVAAEIGGAMQTDFSHVRLHRGEQSDSLNQSFGSLAFTVGQDIFMSSGAHEGGERGKALLAHELTHVVQQGAASDDGIVRRALGIEIECSKLPVRQHPEGAKKGDIIADGTGFVMMFEETTTKQPVVEFRTEPAPSQGEEFVTAVRGMAKMASTIQNAWFGGKWYGDYKIGADSSDDVGGSIQVTAGTPLDRVTDVYRAFGEGDAVNQIGDIVHEPPVDEELGVDLSELSERARGFIFLCIDYVRRGYVPPQHFSRDQMLKNRSMALEGWKQISKTDDSDETQEQVDRYENLVDRVDDDHQKGYRDVKRYPKATFGVLARNDFQSIFQTVPMEDKLALIDVVDVQWDNSEFFHKQAVLKQKYVDFIIKKGTNAESDKRSLAEKGDEALVNFAFTDRNRIPTKRGEWLRELPTGDNLSSVKEAEVGTYKNKMDRTEDQRAPLLEFRDKLGNMPSIPNPDDWVEKAIEIWKKYEKACGGERVKRGNEY